MAKLIGLKIDVNKITKSKLFKGAKGTYLDLTIALNDEIDQYGNNVSVWEKCEKHEQKNYLGNGKVFWSNDAALTPTAAPLKPDNSTTQTSYNDLNEEDSDNLPF